MAFETGLEGKPWYILAAVGAGLAVVLVVAVHYMKFTQMERDIANRKSRIMELDRQINEGRAAKNKLPQFREEVGRLELKLDKLLRILPPKRNTPDILRRLRNLTEQADFDLLSFSPRSPSPQDFYSEWPIQIRLHGTYHNLALFFDRIKHFSRIINIEDLRIDALRGGGHHTISANFVMKTFMYNDPEADE